MFNLQIANQLVQESQSNEFSIDFDGLWQWCGYSSKQKAKNRLLRNFEESLDYSSKWLKATTTGISAVKVEKINLTITAAKEFAMLAQTEQGREVRRYFIEAEKQLRRPKTALEMAKENVRILEILEASEKKLALQQRDVDFVTSVKETENFLNLNQFAKSIDVSRNLLMSQMRDMQILNKDNTPKQRYMPNYFKTTISVKNKKQISTTLITGKGSTWLHGKLIESGFIDPMRQLRGLYYIKPNPDKGYLLSALMTAGFLFIMEINREQITKDALSFVGKVNYQHQGRSAAITDSIREYFDNRFTRTRTFREGNPILFKTRKVYTHCGILLSEDTMAHCINLKGSHAGGVKLSQDYLIYDLDSWNQLC